MEPRKKKRFQLRYRRMPFSWVAVGMVSALAATAYADNGEKEIKKRKSRRTVNRWSIPVKTLGGRQFWGDVLFFHDWRIQQNVLTRHYRLLDGKNYRHASGSYEECEEALEKIKKEQALPEMSGKVAIVVHGIFRSSKSFSRMRDDLQAAGYEVIGFEYPSTRAEIADSAEYLHRTIESLKGVEEVNFVVHSMGGLVVRAYLARHQDKRIKRMVMMGVPNLGAHMADRMSAYKIYHSLFGPAGKQLISGDGSFAADLPVPEFEFAVIAGCKGDTRGYNPLIPGDDDGTVAVASTRLPGAADFLAVGSLHSFMMYNEDCIDATVRFLQSGRLRETGDPHPIPPKEEPEQSEK